MVNRFFPSCCCVRCCVVMRHTTRRSNNTAALAEGTGSDQGQTSRSDRVVWCRGPSASPHSLVIVACCSHPRSFGYRQLSFSSRCFLNVELCAAEHHRDAMAGVCFYETIHEPPDSYLYLQVLASDFVISDTIVDLFIFTSFTFIVCVTCSFICKKTVVWLYATKNSNSFVVTHSLSAKQTRAQVWVASPEPMHLLLMTMYDTFSLWSALSCTHAAAKGYYDPLSLSNYTRTASTCNPMMASSTPGTHHCPTNGKLRSYAFYQAQWWLYKTTYEVCEESLKPKHVLRKVAKGFRFDCDQNGSFTVFAVYLRFPAVLCGCISRTTEKRGLNCVSKLCAVMHIKSSFFVSPAYLFFVFCSLVSCILHFALMIFVL